MKIRLILTALILSLLPVFVFAQEQLTISTYYPSPYGSYDELQAGHIKIGNNNTNTTVDGVVNFWPQAAPATANEGDLFYNSGTHGFQYKDNTAGWKDLQGTVPSGTWCGEWASAGTAIDNWNCLGVSPQTSCPAGYTRKQPWGAAGNWYVCVKN